MAWNNIDSRLKNLYNAVAKAHNEGTSYQSSIKAEEEAINLMNQLSEELQHNKCVNRRHIENIVWHIETNGSKLRTEEVLDAVYQSLKNILKETE